MKYLILLTIILTPSFVSAYNLFSTEIDKPYEPMVVDDEDLSHKQVFMGELTGFPVMYEISVGEGGVLKAKIRQLYQGGSEPEDFSLILIRENDNKKGVTEVARLSLEAEEWKVVKDREVGMNFWETSLMESAVESGLYRMEISAPDNSGKYLLEFGEEDIEGSYFSKVSNVRQIQDFFGYSYLKILSSSLIYNLLGVVLLLFVINKIWKYRKLINHAS